MKLVANKLQVRHYPQIPCMPFCVDVANEIEAKKLIDILANQHLFLFEQKIIPDYSNAIVVVMFDESEKEWVNYWNDAEELEWDEFETMYLSEDAEPIATTNINEPSPHSSNVL